MTLPDSKIGDKGQRYEIGVIDRTIDEFHAKYNPRKGEPNPKLDLTDDLRCVIEWIGWGPSKDSFREAIRLHPGKKHQLRVVYDREESRLFLFTPADDEGKYHEGCEDRIP